MSTASMIRAWPTKFMRIAGLELSLPIVIGAAIVWLIASRFAHHDPLWGMISVVIVSDTELNASLTAFRGRVLNTVIGCAIGLLALYAMGTQSWSILVAMSVAVLVSSNFALTVPAWRIAPVTVVIVMMPGLLIGSRTVGTAVALNRTAWVLVGSAVAVVVSLLFAFFKGLRRRAPEVAA
jgi:uncharacterized membrane protein YgaE (UPF0421/DUF939 family)